MVNGSKQEIRVGSPHRRVVEVSRSLRKSPLGTAQLVRARLKRGRGSIDHKTCGEVSEREAFRG